MPMFKLSQEGIHFIQQEMKRYETKLSAVIPALYRVQQENGGWVSSECVTYLSQLMKISESKIYEALTFYTLFNKKPVGPLHIQVCCNITCAMLGGRELLKKLKHHFSNKNSVCTFSAVECLGSCDTAPVIQINREPYIENANEEKAIEIIEKRSTSFIKNKEQ